MDEKKEAPTMTPAEAKAAHRTAQEQGFIAWFKRVFGAGGQGIPTPERRPRTARERVARKQARMRTQAQHRKAEALRRRK